MRSFSKSTMLWAALVGTAILAALGIWAVLDGEWTQTHFQIFASTLIVYGCGVMSLPCLYAVEKNKNEPVGIAGLVIIGLTGLQSLSILWEWYTPDSEYMMKVFVSSWIVSATVFGALLTLMAKTTQAMKWLPATTAVGMAVLGGIAVTTVFAEAEPPIELVICLSIAVTCGFIMSWILHMIEWIHEKNNASVCKTVATGEVICPRCGSVQAEVDGQNECHACHTLFTIDSRMSHVVRD
jgi:hypothetical protein